MVRRARGRGGAEEARTVNEGATFFTFGTRTSVISVGMRGPRANKPSEFVILENIFIWRRSLHRQRKQLPRRLSRLNFTRAKCENHTRLFVLLVTLTKT
jgi:hypothetical protein